MKRTYRDIAKEGYCETPLAKSEVLDYMTDDSNSISPHRYDKCRSAEPGRARLPNATATQL